MDARPLLETLARALGEARQEAILIGNAAAALQGAPVTTIDFDFYFRKTPRNLEKLKLLTKNLGAMLSAIVKSKRAAGRPRDHAVLDIPEASLHEEEARNQRTKTRCAKGRK